MGQRADHLEDPMEGHLVGQKVDHLVDLMEGRSVDLMEVRKGQEVTMVASLLSGRLVLLEPVQVVQLVVREEGTVLAQIVPALVELVSTNQQQAEQLARLQLALRAADRELE